MHTFRMQEQKKGSTPGEKGRVSADILVRATRTRRMTLTWWLSIGAGLGVMGGHTALRVLTHRLALSRPTRKGFLLLELGGLGARMMLVFAAVALILLYVPVRPAVFVGTVLVLLLLSMVLEARRMYQRMERGEMRP
jgi:hypothetical protein